MVFVCLEYLRGRYQTGNEHLRNGIRVIGGLAGAGNILDLEAPMDPADIWLMETFGRLNLQANLLGQGVRFTYNVVQSFDSQPMPVIFTSIRVARKQLDWLQSEIILLTNRWERLNEHSPLKDPPPNLIDLRLRILKELESWERTYTVSRVTLVAQMGAVGNCVYVMLRLYHKMARIMASTCFLPNGETSFDDHTDDFVQIITESIDFHNYTKSIPMDKVFTHRPDISPFTSDKGCIPPLYFTAIKCRVHRIRLQAIRALMVTLSKEGVWDAQLAGAVGGEVMRLEEGGFYKDIPLEDDFAWDQVPTEKDFQSPELPENNRMHSVQVILPNSRQDEAVIVCKRRTETGISDTITRTYDPVLKKWSDGHGKTTLLATAYI